MVQAMVEFSRQMTWRKVSVIYADDDYSIAIVRAIDRQPNSSAICFESFSNVGDAMVAVNPDTDTTAFWVIAPPEEAQNITRLLITADASRRFQWLFSHPWSAEQTNVLQELSGVSDVFALAVSPVMIDVFEKYWTKRKSPLLQLVP